MMRFRYIAEDSNGARSDGEVAAADVESARSQLHERGLQVIELESIDAVQESTPSKLSTRESEDVVIAVAELSSSELPLAEGLRAAATEATSRRVQRALRRIAADIESGYALGSIMSDRGEFLPPHVRGLVAAASRTGRLGLALDDLVEHQRSARELWGKVIGSIAYPLLVLGMTLFVLLFLPIFIVPQFAVMFEEFELELPVATRMIIEISDSLLWFSEGPGLWIIGIFASVIGVLIVISSLGIGIPITHRFTTTMPLVGPIWQWSGAAAFARLLATLLEYDIPLPEALLLTRDGVRDPDIRGVVTKFSDGVENGKRLSELMQSTNQLPATMCPFVAWGERTGNLPEALHAIADMLVTRVQMRTVLLRSVAPPAVFILVGIFVGFMIIALFMPLVSLIQGLS